VCTGNERAAAAPEDLTSCSVPDLFGYRSTDVAGYETSKCLYSGRSSHGHRNLVGAHSWLLVLGIGYRPKRPAHWRKHKLDAFSASSMPPRPRKPVTAESDKDPNGGARPEGHKADTSSNRYHMRALRCCAVVPRRCSPAGSLTGLALYLILSISTLGVSSSNACA